MAKIYTPKNDMSYSEAIEEIQAIVEKLSKDEINIDSLPNEVKRGAELISMCKKRLKSTEESIDKVFKED